MIGLQFIALLTFIDLGLRYLDYRKRCCLLTVTSYVVDINDKLIMINNENVHT